MNTTSAIKCSRCGTIMEDYGTQKLITGEVCLRDIAEGQESLPVQVHICPKCGKVEFTATQQTAAKFLSRKGLKKCVKCDERIPLASEECPHCGAKQQKPKSRTKRLRKITKNL